MKKKHISSEEFKNLCDRLKNKGIDPHGFIHQDFRGAVVIQEGVESIPGGAFEGGEGPLTVILPYSLKLIGKNAFKNCIGLTRIEIPKGVRTIPNGCFEGCANLREVILPEGLMRIGDRAFRGCFSLTDINLPSSLEIIDDFAFFFCRNLGTIVFGPHLNEIGLLAFDNCCIRELRLAEHSRFFPLDCYIFSHTPILSIAVDPKNEGYEDSGCNIIMEKATGRIICGSVNSSIPENAISIAEGAFRTAPKNLDIPSSVKRIELKAIMSSESRFIIQEGVEIIDEWAFIPDDHEDSHNVVFVPPCVRSIGGQFSSVEFHLYDENPYYRFDSAGQNIIREDDGTLVWGRLLQGIPQGVTDVDVTLDRNPGYSKLTIPESVTHVGNGLFSGHHIESIVINQGTDIYWPDEEIDFELKVVVPLWGDGTGMKMTCTFDKGTPVQAIRDFLGDYPI